MAKNNGFLPQTMGNQNNDLLTPEQVIRHPQHFHKGIFSLPPLKSHAQIGFL